MKRQIKLCSPNGFKPKPFISEATTTSQQDSDIKNGGRTALTGFPDLLPHILAGFEPTTNG